MFGADRHCENLSLNCDQNLFQSYIFWVKTRSRDRTDLVTWHHFLNNQFVWDNIPQIRMKRTNTTHDTDVAQTKKDSSPQTKAEKTTCPSCAKPMAKTRKPKERMCWCCSKICCGPCMKPGVSRFIRELAGGVKPDGTLRYKRLRVSTKECRGCHGIICQSCFDIHIDKHINDVVWDHEDFGQECCFYDTEEEIEKNHPEKCEEMLRSKKYRQNHINDLFIVNKFYCTPCSGMYDTNDY